MSSYLPDAAIDTRFFPSCYHTGRNAWLAEVGEGASTLAFACQGVGPEGEDLCTDTAWLGAADARNVVVLIGGTHGVEGLVGTAVQRDVLRLLAAGHWQLPPDTALLLIHALTPWGYAWLRRCDADGVDLNRNIVDFSQPLPENTAYESLRPALLLTDVQQRQAAFAAFAGQYGRVALEQAISGGQYTDPSGPFYGGVAPAHGRKVVEELISRYALGQRNVAVVDLHSGLGSFGYGEIICDHQPDSPATALARHWYGESVMLPLLGTSSSVPKQGLLDYAWHAVMNPRSCYITLEFGSYPTEQLFEVLLRDHQLWAADHNAAARKAHSQLMRQHFCPDDQSWRELVLFRARQVIGQALHGVSA
ncbi:MAG: DUF2817 domain-containing protein [Methylococcaceae bacterium]|nr:DUF2817 domain-containing protein [Methylococcaceae bacterium]